LVLQVKGFRPGFQLAQVVRDFFRGSLIVLIGTIGSLIGLILLLILWVFFHVLGGILVIFLFLFVVFFSVWLIGYAYRKMKELK
jgi:hypothetical protein